MHAYRAFFIVLMSVFMSLNWCPAQESTKQAEPSTAKQDEAKTKQEVPEDKKNATEKKENDGDQKLSDNEAAKAFKQIKKLVKANKWDKVAKLMTKKAQDEFVVEQVISAIGLTEMNIQFPIPGLEEAIDEIDNVLVKYKFDELDVDTSSMFRMEFSMDESDGDDENEEEMPHDGSEVIANESAKILAHVSESGKQWEIVKELWNAKAGSPFSMSPFVGKIKNTEVDNEVTFLEVEMGKAQSSDDGGGIVVQMVAPPVAIRMIKEGQDWKLDGRDEKRTRKLMADFMKNQQNMMPPPTEDFDF